MASIMEALQNANYNLDSSTSANVITNGKGTIKQRFVTLLDKGYDIWTE